MTPPKPAGRTARLAAEPKSFLSWSERAARHAAAAFAPMSTSSRRDEKQDQPLSL